MARPKERTTVCESGLVSLSFSPDRKRAAFSPNNHVVHIADCGANYADCTTWKIVATLERHDHSVTGVDWSSENNSILTCSHDRTAFVWKETTPGANDWEAYMVMLDTTIQKGVTACKWSANGLKAYFGSASANVVMAHFDESNNWWHCKAIDKHTSTVTALAPHPTVNTTLASGGTDSVVLLTSTLTKAVDGKTCDAAKFGTVLAEIPFRAWVHCLAWSPGSSATLAVATHDSRVHVITFPSSTLYTDPVVQSISLDCLPVCSLAFVSGSQLIGAGFDFYAMLFAPRVDAKGNPFWALKGKWLADLEPKKEKTEAEIAREKFQNQASTGQSSAVELPKSRHKNVISTVAVIVAPTEEAVPSTSKAHLFATASMDGRVEYWDMNSLVAA